MVTTDYGREADLELALELALAWLSHYEPGDSRAVSNEFVAMAAIFCDANGNREECRQIIRDAIAAQRAETPAPLSHTGSDRELSK